ncbi:MAG: hypothetical protein EOO02_02510 [Chitinophagaceae bacterium]|nr:MAG: hypothetical protein EOO02_02510 [Chitinophagaceae bacterium]
MASEEMKEESGIVGFKLDFEKLFSKIITNIHWILICVVISFVVAKAYLRYQVPVYEVGSNILVSSGEAAATISIISDAPTNADKTVETEVFILKSYSLMRKVVDSLELDKEFIQEARIREFPLDVQTLPFRCIVKRFDNNLTSNRYRLQVFDDHFNIITDNGTKKHQYNSTFLLGKDTVTIVKIRDLNKQNSEIFHFRLLGIDKVVKQCLANLSVTTAKTGKGVVQLSLKEQVPSRGVKFLDVLIREYDRTTINFKNKSIRSAINFLDTRINEIGDDLHAQENEERDYRSSNNIYDVSATAQSVLARLNDLDGQKVLARQNMMMLDLLKRHVIIDNQAELFPNPGVIQDQLLNAQVAAYNELLMRRRMVLDLGTANDPSLLATNGQLRQIRDNILKNIAGIERQFSAHSTMLTEMNSEYYAKYKRLPGKEKELIRLKRDLAIKETLYNFLLQKKEETSIQLMSSDVAGSRVIDIPRKLGLLSPHTGSVTIIFMVVGLFLPVIVISSKVFLNQRIENKRDVEKLTDIPIIGEISYTKKGETNPIVTLEGSKNFITEPLAGRSKKLKKLEDAVVYPDMIQSIFNEKCIGCHNPNKRKGELLLTSYAELAKGGESGAVFFAGNPDSSILYKLLLLPADDERHMPPEGKPQADPEEIALLRWWIQTGAKKDQKYAGAPVPDSIAKIVKAKFDAGSPLDQLNIAFADQKTIQSLATTDRGVRQLSIEKPYINVFMANRKNIGAKELEELEPVRNQITSLDLSYSKLTNDQFKQIAKFPHLTKLFLENSNLNDTVLSALSGLQYLEYLNVSNTKVSDAIFATADKLKSLKKLFVYGDNITTASINAYRKRMPAMITGFTPDLSADTSYRGRLTNPIVTIDSNVFLHNATVEMNYRIRGVDLRYTLDGSDPDSSSALYKEPFEISGNTVLKTRAVRSGWEPSDIQSFTFVKADHSFSGVKLDSMADKRYQGRLDTTLIDLQRGSLEQGDGNYLGFEGNDLRASLQLAAPTQIGSISVSYLVRHSSYLMSPVSFEAWSLDASGKVLKQLGKVVISENRIKENASKEEAVIRFPPQSLQYIRIKVTNRGKLPAWHPAKGAKSWLFVDEIVI